MIEKNPWAGWWQWLLIPVAVVSSVVLLALFFECYTWFIELFFGVRKSGWIQTYFTPAIKFGFAGYFSVISGCYVAPKGKVIVGVIISTTLTIIGLLFWSTIIGVLFSPNTLNLPTSSIIWAAIYTIVFLGASIFAVITVNNEN